jgi:tRNA threonylcarbamoyl adenosine modification protein (Sua5/YciO/YrdC/YwlC family)
MDAVVYKIEDECKGWELLPDLREYVCGGQAFVFPTDTVYGLGAVVADAAIVPCGLAEIFALKERSASKPLPLLIAGAKALSAWACDVPSYAYALAKQHWPGALTLVLRAKPRVNPAFVNAADGSIALRVPDSEFLLALLRGVGNGAALLATSANVSGQPPAHSVDELDKLVGRLPLIIDGGTIKGAPSTIISCLGAAPVVLRQGSVKI